MRKSVRRVLDFQIFSLIPRKAIKCRCNDRGGCFVRLLGVLWNRRGDLERNLGLWGNSFLRPMRMDGILWCWEGLSVRALILAHVRIWEIAHRNEVIFKASMTSFCRTQFHDFVHTSSDNPLTASPSPSSKI